MKHNAATTIDLVVEEGVEFQAVAGGGTRAAEEAPQEEQLGLARVAGVVKNFPQYLQLDRVCALVRRLRHRLHASSRVISLLTASRS
jgi:hypothetical protein